MKTGKVKQVAAFGKLVGISNTLGARYNPSIAALTPTALAAKLEQAQQNAKAVNDAGTAFTLAVNARKESYAGIYSLAARVVRALAAAEGSVENVKDARALRRKLAPPKGPAVAPPAAATTAGATPPPVHHKLSMQDFDSKVNVFAQLVSMVESLPSYAPNEVDLQVATLKNVLADLQSKNSAVNAAASAFAQARSVRNAQIFGENGLLETYVAVKEYVRAAFGLNSNEAKEITNLRLTA